jgi:Uma2 family endonuclease
MTTLLEEVAAGCAPPLQPLTAFQMHRMREAGILSEGTAAELIDGLLVRRNRADQGGDPMVHGPRHALSLKRLQRLERRVEGHGCHFHCQLPLALADDTEPEPDLAVVRGTPEDFARQHPGPDAVLAVFEVADSSLDTDRTTKQRIYARAGIPVYGIVNLRNGCLEVYDQPSAGRGRYARQTVLRAGQTARVPLPDGTSFEIDPAEVLA